MSEFARLEQQHERKEDERLRRAEHNGGSPGWSGISAHAGGR
jgi:hypothetical protein